MTERCANCDAPLSGRYCAACGQKRIEPEERRVSWFIRQVVEATTMVDERFLGSLTRLMFRPGRLERAWLEGRRRRHLAPLTLFLIANLIYFVYPPLTDFNLSLHDQATQQPWSSGVDALVERRLAEREISFDEYAAEYGARAQDLAKIMVIVQVPIFAMVLMMLHYRRRLFFVDHLAVSLNFHAFLLITVLALPLILRVSGAMWLWQWALLAIIVYAWRQIQVAYDQTWWLALAKLPAVLIGVIVAHMCYRAMQFGVAFALT